MRGKRWLLACAALAAGEYAALSFAECCALWPVMLVLAVLVFLYGYGFDLTGWPEAVLVLGGLALGFRASVAEVEFYRECPWLRGRNRVVRSMVDPSLVMTGRIRRALAKRVGLGLPPRSEVAALNRAILLGERRKLSGRTRQLFIESGTMHIFAISGLHVMAIATVLAVLVRVLFAVPGRWAGLVSLPVLWGYVLIIGSPPSAVRAAMMASFGALAPIFWRRPDGLVSWSLTFLIVHLKSPEMMVNVGSVLSFAVMLSIQLTGNALRGYGRCWWCSLATTVVAWAVGVPIAAHVFGRLTPGGILANLILISAAQWTVYAGALGVMASFCSVHLASHLNGLSSLFTQLMVLVSEVVSRLPGANWEIANWTIGVCAVWYGGLLIAVILVRWLWRRLNRWIWYNKVR